MKPIKLESMDVKQPQNKTYKTEFGCLKEDKVAVYKLEVEMPNPLAALEQFTESALKPFAHTKQLLLLQNVFLSGFLAGTKWGEMLSKQVAEAIIQCHRVEPIPEDALKELQDQLADRFLMMNHQELDQFITRLRQQASTINFS